MKIRSSNKIGLLILISFFTLIGCAKTSSNIMYYDKYNNTYARISHKINEECKNLKLKDFKTYSDLNSIKLITKSVKTKEKNTDDIKLNIKKLFSSKGEVLKLAVIQADTLSVLAKYDKDSLKNIIILAPLTSEEIHVLVRKDLEIENFKDLNGKKVSIGKKGSSNWMTAKKLENIYKIKFDERNYTLEDGLDKLEKGEIDALIIVGKAPIPELEKINAPNFYLFSFGNDITLHKLYVIGEIEEGTYPFQKKAITTFLTYVFLITSQKHKNQAQDIVSCLIQNKKLKPEAKKELQFFYKKSWEEIENLIKTGKIEDLLLLRN